MTMPNFTAEASLYKTSEHYQLAQVIAAVSSEGTVVPQQMTALRAPVDDVVVSCRCPCCICVGRVCVCC